VVVPSAEWFGAWFNTLVCIRLLPLLFAPSII
jgi:hypothetical protein